MIIVIAGASGLIGTALQKTLRQAGHQVFPIVRGAAANGLFHWQPSDGRIHFDSTFPVDVLINLSGAGIADKRWAPDRKLEILKSRVDSTRLLTETIVSLPTRPKLLISGSAIGFYGETGGDSVDETGSNGEGFLAEVASRWEAAAEPAIDAGIRTVFMRTGIVLNSRGGALNRMLKPFKCGLGGVVGTGGQYMSWVSLKEIINMIIFIIGNESLSGPVNLVSPQAVTNREFTRCLGRVLKRPTLIPLPGMLARAAFGEMADHLLLSSIRVYPKVLEEAGYQFLEPGLEVALEGAVQGDF